MMTDTMADNRAAAAMMPTGPTATQIKDRANAAGTDGPPPKAPTRADPADQSRNSTERPIIFDQSAPQLTRSAVENQMAAQPNPTGDDAAVAMKTAQRLTDLAKAAFAETQTIVRDTQDARAAAMRVAM